MALGGPGAGVQPKFYEEKILQAEGPQDFFRVRLGRAGATIEQEFMAEQGCWLSAVARARGRLDLGVGFRALDTRV